MRRRIAVIAIGRHAVIEGSAMVKCLNRTMKESIPIVAIGEMLPGADRNEPTEDFGTAGRWAKVNLDRLVPDADQLMYVDADTRTNRDLSVGFDLLEDGWELVICPSENYGSEWLRNVEDDERELTRGLVGSAAALQGGLFWVRWCKSTRRLWELWRDEWMIYKGQDQGALLRALLKQPVRTWFLHQPLWIMHRFGAAR